MKKIIKILACLIIPVVVFAGVELEPVHSDLDQRQGYEGTVYITFAEPSYVWTNNYQFPFILSNLAVAQVVTNSNTISASLTRTHYDYSSSVTYTFTADLFSKEVVDVDEAFYSNVDLGIDNFRFRRGDVVTFAKTHTNQVVSSSATAAGTTTITDTNATWTADAYIGYAAIVAGTYYDIIDNGTNTLTLDTSAAITNGQAYTVDSPVELILDLEQ